METLWFALVSAMLTAYVILDGYDLGAGVLHNLIGYTEDERHMVLRSIGPYWDGNEVWLLAAGGTLYFAFPPVYASSFGGFYLPLIIVLWLLMARGISIELWSHVNNSMWRSFFDLLFTAASALLAVFFGAALGNVVRGVPLDAQGYFFAPLWGDFTTSGQIGILDWYTVLIGVLALTALTSHGAAYLAMKLEGDVQARARRLGSVVGAVLVLLTIASVPATLVVRPEMTHAYGAHLWGLVFPAGVAAGLGGMAYFRHKRNDVAAFGASALFLASMLGGAAFGLYPNLLPSTSSAGYSLTVWNSAAARHGLRIGIVWWLIGMALAVTYFTFLHRSFRGKVTLKGEGY